MHLITINEFNLRFENFLLSNQIRFFSICKLPCNLSLKRICGNNQMVKKRNMTVMRNVLYCEGNNFRKANDSVRIVYHGENDTCPYSSHSQGRGSSSPAECQFWPRNKTFFSLRRAELNFYLLISLNRSISILMEARLFIK